MSTTQKIITITNFILYMVCMVMFIINKDSTFLMLAILNYLLYIDNK